MIVGAAKMEFAKRPPENEKQVIEDFIKKSRLFCNLVNPHLKEWNEEFNRFGFELRDDDPLFAFGGIKYCSFINKKMQKYIDMVNQFCEVETGLRLGIDCIGSYYGELEDGNRLYVKW